MARRQLDPDLMQQLAAALQSGTCDEADTDPALRAARREKIEAARDVLNMLLAEFESSSPPQPPPPSAPDMSDVVEGRYDGGNHALVLELRLDFAGSGVISGDLFGTQGGQRDYLASFRTAPGSNVTPHDAQPWTAVFEATNGEVLTGSLELAPGSAPGTVIIGLSVAGAIDGLPANRQFELAAEWQSPHMRRLGIELEQETGTQPPPVFDFNGRGMTFLTAFADAGIEVTDVGNHSTIPRETDGWGTAQLHTLMTDFAAEPLTRMAWRQQLLWLGTPSRSGLLGVMFDTTAQLPRQGTAVFDSEIRSRVPTLTERKIIQTTVHEIGHGLNLAHRFERPVGRADSNSFMNYDWRYKGGNRRHEFWNDFNFTFDADELEFLRHAPRKAVIPGGAAFHSVNYWADGNGGYSPYVPEKTIEIVDLRLAPPTGGTVFAFGQPVFLQISLVNNHSRPLNLDPRFLDPKSGFLEVLVRRIGAGGHADVHHFHPMLERCFDLDMDALDTVAPGGSMTDNLNITFGSGGFTFAEPGQYEITAVLAIYDQQNEQDLIVRSNAQVIHVAHPENRVEEEEVVLVLHREDVGAYFALGGSAALDKAEDDLKAVLDRRQSGRKTVTDPIVANILRCQGIDAGRRYRRYSSGRYRSQNGKPDKAAELLGRLGKEALCAFDASTAAATQSLCDKHRERAADQTKVGKRRK
ncbi:MAG: hypothetical protein ABJN98_02965 [Roseibium sp.]|uniref:hypothetical protein n=1 Tax=Roseibium polysiphoniae TaxID=2571221 RepID=UPI00329A28A7